MLNDLMKRLALTLGLLILVAGAVLREPLHWSSFMAGVAVFAANIALLAVLIDRLFYRGALEGGASRLVLGLLAFVKLVLVGVGAYVALVVLDLEALYFVGGALVALMALTLVCASPYLRKFSLFSVKKVRY